MSNLACRCGHIIMDYSDCHPYQANFIPTEHEEKVWKTLTDAAMSLASTGTAEGRSAWLKHHGFGEGYPEELSQSDMFWDLMTSQWLKYYRTVYEYIQCGRLWLQIEPNGNRFVSYKPESDRYEEILSGSKKSEDGA